VYDPALAPVGSNLDTGKLEMLSRPYPRVVAGTPLGWSFAQGEFRASWSVQKAAGKGEEFPAGSLSEIAVPARAFPDGYGVSVEGGRVVSRAGAPVLRVAQCPAAKEISLRVAQMFGGVEHSCRAPRLRVSVRPRRVPAGEPTQLRIRVRPPLRAWIHIAGRSRSRRTSNRGKLRLTETFTRPGKRRITARKPGYRPGKAVLRVR
jgi:hypothetical protein